MAAPIQLASVGSTSDWVRDHADRLADGQWVLAKRQTRGRGRMGRGWEAPPGNFAGSCRLRPAAGETPVHLMSLVAALALHDACAQLVPAGRLQLKWPNDLLLDGAKLSGILLERDGASGCIILGIGVNLRHAPDVPGRQTAALAGASEAVPTPLAFACILKEALDRRRAEWRRAGPAALCQAWQARAHPPGTWLRVQSDGAMLSGQYLGLAADGALRLLVDGSERRIHAGDIAMPGDRLEEAHAAGD